MFYLWLLIFCFAIESNAYIYGCQFHALKVNFFEVQQEEEAQEFLLFLLHKHLLILQDSINQSIDRNFDMINNKRDQGIIKNAEIENSSFDSESVVDFMHISRGLNFAYPDFGTIPSYSNFKFNDKNNFDQIEMPQIKKDIQLQIIENTDFFVDFEKFIQAKVDYFSKNFKPLIYHDQLNDSGIIENFAHSDILSFDLQYDQLLEFLDNMPPNQVCVIKNKTKNEVEKIFLILFEPIRITINDKMKTLLELSEADLEQDIESTVLTNWSSLVMLGFRKANPVSIDWHGFSHKNITYDCFIKKTNDGKLILRIDLAHRYYQLVDANIEGENIISLLKSSNQFAPAIYSIQPQLLIPLIKAVNAGINYSNSSNYIASVGGNKIIYAIDDNHIYFEDENFGKEVSKIQNRKILVLVGMQEDISRTFPWQLIAGQSIRHNNDWKNLSNKGQILKKLETGVALDLRNWANELHFLNNKLIKLARKKIANLEILKKMFEKPKVRPEETFIDTAFWEGKLNQSNWLADFFANIFGNLDGAKTEQAEQNIANISNIALDDKLRRLANSSKDRDFQEKEWFTVATSRQGNLKYALYIILEEITD